MNVIIGNFGNDTLALIQWAIESHLRDVYVLSIDTRWAASTWASRVEEMERWIKKQEFFTWIRLQSLPFSAWVIDRQEFPTPKHQWCAGLLKGAPINAWLESHDPEGKAVILLAKRKVASKLLHDLPEIISESPHYGGRKIWHPLYNHTDKERNELIERAGFSILQHRSLECDPCIHNQISDFQRMDQMAIDRTNDLENQIGKVMFCPNDYEEAIGIEAVRNQVLKKIASKKQDNSFVSFDSFNSGCGSPWSCGE